jgi:glutaconate CoA-transferase subunit A
VSDGTCVYIGNFGAQLHCVGHEIVRQRLSDLHVVMGSGGILLDLLLGAGVVARATFGHCWSPVGPAPAYRFRELTETGSAVAFEELSVATLTGALQAAAWRVSFAPIPDIGETAYVTEGLAAGWIGRADSTFGPALVARALVPDVAFVHADVVDEDGNAVIRGPVGEAALAAVAARSTVIVAEEVITRKALRARVSECAVPGIVVRAIVEHPGAVAPDGAMGRYARDLSAYEQYAAASRDRESFSAWLRRHVLEDQQA